MTTKPELRGIWAAVLTPCDRAGNIDVPRWAAHARRLLAEGCHGLGVFGSTSETLSYSVAERQAGLEALLATGIEPRQIVLGVGCCARADTVALTRHALQHGVERALMLPPFFYKNNSDEGLYRAFAEVVDMVGDPRLELLLYHFPQLSGVPVTIPVVERLAAAYPDTLKGIKDSSGDLAHTLGLVKAFPGLAIFAGADIHLLELLGAGGAGTISAAANINAAASRHVFDAFTRGDRDIAIRGMELVAAVRTALQTRPLIPALKAVVAASQGDPEFARVRPPLVELDRAATDAFLAEIRAAGWSAGSLAKAA
jgi:4-hydroxy-tetrahydrodipicolinate synthase